MLQMKTKTSVLMYQQIITSITAIELLELGFR
jgi:hypothetical protein